MLTDRIRDIDGRVGVRPQDYPDRGQGGQETGETPGDTRGGVENTKNNKTCEDQKKTARLKVGTKTAKC